MYIYIYIYVYININMYDMYVYIYMYTCIYRYRYYAYLCIYIYFYMKCVFELGPRFFPSLCLSFSSPIPNPFPSLTTCYSLLRDSFF